MGTEIANVQADLSKRVVALAGSGDWSREAALALLGDADLDLLISNYERGLVPLGEDEGIDGKGKLSVAIEDGLAMIAVKLNPTMSAEQADAWTKTIRLALSDLPGRVIREAVQAALRKPIRFFPEVDGVVRECADDVMARHRLALFRLRRMKQEIEEAANPKPSLEAPEGWEGGSVPPMTLEQARELAGGFAGRSMLNIGLALGAITQEIYDQITTEGTDDGQSEQRSED